ncbi:MAG: zinc-binding dehydrogenase, partial [Burkholderiales bacterium]
GFAERLRAHWMWVFPLPEALDASASGPLLCGGVTVFAPLLLHGIKPTQRVGVIGIGGLGHMALRFLKAWGCEVTAFTSSESKYGEARKLGAHHVVATGTPAAIEAIAGSLDLVLNTVNVPLNWKAIMATLAPKGQLHHLGAVLEPFPVDVPAMLFGQNSVSGSPTGSPSAITAMLNFAARHDIIPQVEHFPMREVNNALEHLRAGKARYRIVLDADFT